MLKKILFLVIIIIIVLIAVFVMNKRNAGNDVPPKKTMEVEQTQNQTDNDTKEVPLKDPLEMTFVAPTFDIIRVEQDGRSVFAGKGTKGTLIRLYDGQNLIGEGEIDSNGEWVLIPNPLKGKGTKEITLLYQDLDKNFIKLDKTVVVHLIEETAEQTTPLVIAQDSDLKTDIIQKTTQQDSVKDTKIIIDSIQYAESDNVFVQGRAIEGASIYTYVNNKFIDKITIGENNQFEIVISLKPGHYKIRFDLEYEQDIIHRLEIPFTKESEESFKNKNNTYIVQPGNSLWRISRYLYGKGTQYTIIYEHNKDFIANPHLIYPGQVLSIPAQ